MVDSLPMRTWQQDIELDLDRCHEIVSGQFPQFAEQVPESWGQGWDNLCVLYGGKTVFRLPTRKMGGEILLNEMAALPLLQNRLTLSIPRFDYLGGPTKAYPYCFVGYEALPGTTSDRLTWTAKMRLQAIEPIAHFLRSLHEIPVTDEFSLNLPAKPHDRSGVDWFLNRIDARRDAVIALHPKRRSWAERLYQLARAIAEGCRGEGTLAIIHGDLYPRHLLAGDDAQIMGVIDWGDVQIAHPGLDLSIAYTFFDVEEREAFWTAYGLPVSEESMALARLKAILYALALFAYGADVEDPYLVDLGEAIAKRVFTK